jgi:hypothetical protein
VSFADDGYFEADEFVGGVEVEKDFEVGMVALRAS